MKKIFKYFLQSIFIYLFFLIGRLLGLKASRKLFASLFSLIGPFFKSKTIVKRNLNILSQTISELNEKKITKNMWENYGKTFIEYIYLDFFRNNTSHMHIMNSDILTEILKENKSVIFVSGHFANFELMSMEITKKNISLATIYRPLNNFFLNPLMEYLRKKYVCSNQIKKGVNGVREAIEYIKNDYSIALMVDQRVSEGEKINFFGKPALTTTLPAKLSLKFGLDIIPVYIQREKNNNFKIEFKKRIRPENFKNDLEITQEVNNIIEKMIIDNPDQWIWSHNRWK